MTSLPIHVCICGHLVFKKLTFRHFYINRFPHFIIMEFLCPPPWFILGLRSYNSGRQYTSPVFLTQLKSIFKKITQYCLGAKTDKKKNEMVVKE